MTQPEPSVDREFLVNAFLARLAIYRQKADRYMLGADVPLSRGEIAATNQEAIEWLAAEIGILDDLKAAGYAERSESE